MIAALTREGAAMQPGDFVVLGIGLAIIVGAATPVFRKLNATQAAAVAFGVLLVATPFLRDYSLSLLGVSISRDQAAQLSDQVTAQLNGITDRLNAVDNEIKVLSSASASPTDKAQVVQQAATAAATYNQAAQAASTFRERLSTIPLVRVTPATAARFSPATIAPAPATGGP
jgi:glycerol-3-phosphate acyltransferase PlsY